MALTWIGFGPSRNIRQAGAVSKAQVAMLRIVLISRQLLLGRAEWRHKVDAARALPRLSLRLLYLLWEAGRFPHRVRAFELLAGAWSEAPTYAWTSCYHTIVWEEPLPPTYVELSLVSERALNSAPPVRGQHSILTLACKYPEQLQTTMFLLDLGALMIVEQPAGQGATKPLHKGAAHCALQAGNLSLVRELLSRGAPVSTPSLEDFVRRELTWELTRVRALAMTGRCNLHNPTPPHPAFSTGWEESERPFLHALRITSGAVGHLPEELFHRILSFC